MTNFNKDLIIGQHFEQKALDYFKYKTVSFPEGNHKEYDFIYNGKIKVEVKSDFMAYHTGNIAIEFECNKKKSGIRATTAKYWVHFVVNPKNINEYVVYKFRVNEFKKFLKGNKFRQTNGGDGYRSSMHLIPVRYLSQYIVERFVPVNGFDNYTISDMGRLYNNKFKKYVGSKLKSGYVHYGIHQNNMIREGSIHILVAEHFLPSSDNPLRNEIDHINHISYDNRVSNLQWVTRYENCMMNNLGGNIRQLGIKYYHKYTDWDDAAGIKRKNIYNTLEEAEINRLLVKQRVRNHLISLGLQVRD